MKTTELLLDMKESHKTILLDILDRLVPAGLEVWAFGSRARWTARETSDLDLVLRNPAQLVTRLEAGVLDDLKEAFEESDLPFMVDLLDWATVSEKFRKVIEREYVVVRKSECVVGRDGWKTFKLGEITTVIDCPHSTPKWTDTGYFVIRNWNVRSGRLNFDRSSFTSESSFLERIRRGKPEFQDLVLTREAPMGEVCMIPKGIECCLGQRVVLLKPNKNIVDPGFLLFSIQSPFVLNQMMSHEGTGSTVSNLRIPSIENLEILLPALPVQHRIAAILSALDEKIELNRQTNQTLEAIAQTLFKEWFVDFNFLSEPRLEGLKDCLDYKSGSSFNQVNHGSDGKLRDICELNPKLLLKKGTVAPYVEMKDLSSDSSTIKRSIRREFTSGSKFQNGDTLLARITPCLENGKTGLVHFLKDEEVGWGSTEFIVMRPKGDVSPFFVYCLARQQCFRDFAIQSMVGSSGRQRVAESILSDFDVVIPDETVMKCFHAAVSPIFQQLNENEQQTATLTATRDTLLPKLMSGEIIV